MLAEQAKAQENIDGSTGARFNFAVLHNDLEPPRFRCQLPKRNSSDEPGAVARERAALNGISARPLEHAKHPEASSPNGQ